MYCTISPGPVSTGLGDDASSAYHRLHHHGRVLGSISRSFNELALGVSAAYLEALTRPAPEAWRTLVVRIALLVQRTHSVHQIVVLGDAEREALQFFGEIVRENADLLAVPAAVGFDMTFEPLYAQL